VDWNVQRLSLFLDMKYLALSYVYCVSVLSLCIASTNSMICVEYVPLYYVLNLDHEVKTINYHTHAIR